MMVTKGCMMVKKSYRHLFRSQTQATNNSCIH